MKAMTAIKTTKMQFDSFWNEVLGSDWYIDAWSVDDLEWETLRNEDVVTIEFMELGWQGDGPARPTEWITASDLVGDLDVFKLWRRWKKRQTVTTIVAEVPTDALAAVLEAIEAGGGTVHSQ